MVVANADYKPIALPIGDPNGIGPEIAVKAALANLDASLLLVGDAHVVERTLQRLAPGEELHLATSGDRLVKGAVNILSVEALAPEAFAPGLVSAQGGRATVEYVKAAVALAQAGEVQAIVACPHNETAINAGGIAFSGYPELVAQLIDAPEGQVFLMLVGGGLRIVHATLHEQLSGALRRLTPTLVAGAARASVEALGRLGVERPRVGVFGVNPHASEGGLFGDDDARITIPAVEILRKDGINAIGPVGADTLLGRDDIDVFVAMYHDQGHIPVKLKAGRFASALTIGAGILFSTVGHGSAHDIAGRGIADPEGILRTIRLLRGAR